MSEPTIISGDEAKQKSPEELFAALASSPQGLSRLRLRPGWPSMAPTPSQRKTGQSPPEVPEVFLGANSLDDRGRGGPFGHRAPLGRSGHHPGTP